MRCLGVLLLSTPHLPALSASPSAGGLPAHADEMSVWEAVVPAGEVIGVQLIRRKRDRGDCRGYGELGTRSDEWVASRLLQLLAARLAGPAAATVQKATHPVAACCVLAVLLAGSPTAMLLLLSAGFVRMANKEAAEVACESVKEVGMGGHHCVCHALEGLVHLHGEPAEATRQFHLLCLGSHTCPQACGVPVAMSLGSSKCLEELHAAAAFSRAAHPLEVPEGEDSSMARLLQAVRRQADPPAAVTTALVALLHVPSRPRLAFPTGRPSRKQAAAQAADGSAAAAAEEAVVAADSGAAAVGTKRKAPPAEGGEGEGGEEEKLPDADNYLDGFPAVAALMEQFRRAGVIVREGA